MSTQTKLKSDKSCDSNYLKKERSNNRGFLQLNSSLNGRAWSQLASWVLHNHVMEYLVVYTLSYIWEIATMFYHVY